MQPKHPAGFQRVCRIGLLLTAAVMAPVSLRAQQPPPPPNIHPPHVHAPSAQAPNLQTPTPARGAAGPGYQQPLQPSGPYNGSQVFHPGPSAGLRVAQAQPPAADIPQVIENRQANQLIHRVQRQQDRVEMVLHSSLILALDHNIPRLQVDNPELLKVTPLSANQVQIHSEKTGVTNIRFWDEQNQLYSVEVVVRPDGKELDELLRSQFPGAKVSVRPTSAGVILKGYADRPEDVNQIVALAQDYYPKVVNNIRIGGTPQVILHVKVMEVSRTKLRQLGVDFTDIFNGGNSFFSSTAAGVGKLAALPQVVGAATTPITATVAAGGNAPTVALGIVNESSGFFLFISALQKNSLLKVLAEPTLVTISGRPAYFLSGGEMPIPIPQSLGTISIQFRKFGTQVDFVPIVLGNGKIRLEVRPKISEIDPTIGTTLNNTTVPGFRTREVDTAVELMAGQTLALAGLIQTEVQSSVQGVPYLMDIPYLGVPFRYTTDTVNEVELLIMCRPELAEPLDCDQLPPGGPGTGTTVPDSCGMYFRGYTEVPVNGDALNPPPPSTRGWGNENLLPPAEAIPPGQPYDAAPGPSAMRDGLRPTMIGPDPRTTYARMPASSPDADAYAGRAPQARPAAVPLNRSNPQSRQTPAAATPDSEPPMFIGPTGYDLSK